MDDQTRLAKLKETFDAASQGYDSPALRFFDRAADQLVRQMNLTGHEHVLDVACGTGKVSLACASHLADGWVTGIDLSEGMLARARLKAGELNLKNVAFECMALETMPFEAGSFDGACCGFGLFFLPDMEAALKAVAHHVRPGGAIGISSFTGTIMEPWSTAFIDRIQTYGLEVPPLSWKRLDDVAKHHAVYDAAGISDVKTVTVQAGYDLEGFDQWWDILWFSGFRGLLNQLSASDLAEFKQLHQAEVEQLAEGKRIWLDVEVLVSVGCKPSHREASGLNDPAG